MLASAWPCLVVATVAALVLGARVAASDNQPKQWTLLQYRATHDGNARPGLVLPKSSSDCTPQRDSTTHGVVAHVAYKCHGATYVTRVTYSGELPSPLWLPMTLIGCFVDGSFNLHRTSEGWHHMSHGTADRRLGSGSAHGRW